MADDKLTVEQVEGIVREELPALRIDQSKVKLREWNDLEDVADRPVTPWIGANYPPLWFIQGVLWLWLRRSHPQLGYQDLGEIDTELLFEVSGLLAKEAEQPDPPGPNPNGQPPPGSPVSATSGG